MSNAEQTAVTESADATSQEQVQKPKATAKIAATGNLIFDTATELAALTKTKARNEAEKLAENIDQNSFRLGGLLALIQANQWYDGFPTFDAYVQEKFGFKVRKAHYLIHIYKSLVDNQIPWDKVAGLGWSKLKDLAPVLTLENVDDWVAKASVVSVTELQKLLAEHSGTGDASTAKSVSTKDEVIGLKFKVHTDQNELIQAALAKAKGELNTEYDTVALAGICSGYLSGASATSASAQVDPVALFANMGYEKVLGVFEQVFPQIDLTVSVAQG